LAATDGSGASANGKSLTEDQKILHVLNRLGFGARPGDVERVRAVGLEKYIERQLNPNAPDDSRLAAKLKDHEILDLETSEIFARYPNPGALLRMLEGGNNGRRNAPNGGAEDEKSEREQQTERRERRRKIAELYRKYNLKPANQIMQQVQSARILRAAYSEKQLEETMVDFWANHFNVFSGKAATRWYIPSYERDVLRKHALGNFRDLVAGTARHPAMLFYLDNFQSVAENTNTGRTAQQQRRLQRLMNNPRAQKRFEERLKERGLSDEQIEQRIEQLKTGRNGRSERGINENYARELMELHTLGVDGGYTSEDIREVARAFTGWTIFDARGYRKAAANMIKDVEQDRQIKRQARQFGISPDTESGTFIFVDRLHDKGEKTVLGQKVNEGGIKDGLKVIDILVRHPSTAKFIARKLAVKFVNDNPDEAFVERIAKAFQKSDGDIKTTLRAIFNDKEFYAPENYRAKIKTPFELLVSSLRALDAETYDARGLIALLNRMGEPLYGYQAPTGYPDTAGDWVNTGALLERMNFAVALTSNRIPQTRVSLEQYAASDKNAILEKSIAAILHGEIAGGTKSTLLKQMAQPLPEVNLSQGNRVMNGDEEFEDFENVSEDRPQRGNRRQARLLSEPSGNPEIFKVVGLILGSPDFQRQ
jgi:uncharacterized protein (DUF1800 family)